MRTRLVLEDGSEFWGVQFGAPNSVTGEVVFQTGMVGYVESLTDPSYRSQILILTYPLVGNYGVPNSEEDELGLLRHFESRTIHAAGLVIAELSPAYSHWLASKSLEGWLKDQNVPGIQGLDSRMLTKKIRQHGTMLGAIIPEGYPAPQRPFPDPNLNNLVAAVSTRKVVKYGPSSSSKQPPLRVALLDVGTKFNQIRCLARRNCVVTVLPWDHSLSPQTLIGHFDGLFLSNGPGDPTMCKQAVAHLRELLASDKCSLPIFGICLGHQLLSLAAGASTFKLKYGHRGHNQPCLQPETGRCFITSQNHGYAVSNENLPVDWLPLFVNANDDTNEGIIHSTKPFFSVQFHPEHNPGPADLEFLFDVFVDYMRSKVDNKGDDSGLPSIREIILNKLASTNRTPQTNGYLDSANGKPPQITKVVLLGSGGLSIGQAGEFDYSGSQALKSLKEEGIEVVLINPNIATFQTTPGLAAKTYLVPITPDYVTEVLEAERPNGILLSFGGQTALNCGLELEKRGVLGRLGISVLGTPLDAIRLTEDRQLFADQMHQINEPVCPSAAAYSVQEALKVVQKIGGYPVLIRSAYALGGLGSGFVSSDSELEKLANKAFANSAQIFIDKSLRGWKELEYEVVRDAFGNTITVCNMENLDPIGIHTGESIVVAPSQTLSDADYQMLRSASIRIVNSLGIVGECNVQYALDPKSTSYYVVEVNARLSRSSALASKATGYPLAYVAAKLSLGLPLPTLRNSVTGVTTACFEPSLDYCVVKVPRWDLRKFARACTKIGTCMKSVGEAMAIARSFEEAFQKALRMADADGSCMGFDSNAFAHMPTSELDAMLANPTYERILGIAAALRHGYTVDRIYSLTAIDPWFLSRLRGIIDHHLLMENLKRTNLNGEVLLKAKRLGFSDRQIAAATESTETAIRDRRHALGLRPRVKQIDTLAAEWPAATNYLYLTYGGGSDEDDFVDYRLNLQSSSTTKNVANGQSVLVLGSGVYRIGSSVEFDCCAVGCVAELRRLGYSTAMLNHNPETVSTDYDMCDRLYFEELSLESVLEVYALEKPHGSIGLVLSMGGQQPNNIAIPLAQKDVPVLGTSAMSIDTAENRFKFSRLLDNLGTSQPQWRELSSISNALAFAQTVGYPVLVRPSYVLSGAAMNVAYADEELSAYLATATCINKDHPVVISKYIEDAKEIDIDAVALDGRVVCLAVSEHVENAGVHSGDATLVCPPQDINSETMFKLRNIVVTIARHLNVTGPFNLQLIAKDNELRVIECNLRVSRSFPFVSKTLGYNFISAATRAIIGQSPEAPPALVDPDRIVEVSGHVTSEQCRVGVKVPVFSFSRLQGSDALLGVEMASTGEVACFGEDRYDAYLKALLAAGFRLPQRNILLSIGSYRAKLELMPFVRMLTSELGYQLFGSAGTADFYAGQGIPIQPIDWPVDNSSTITGENGAGSGSNSSTALVTSTPTVGELLQSHQVDLVINIPFRSGGSRRLSTVVTQGYRTRRMALDLAVPLITDTKAAKMFVQALRLSAKKRPHSKGHYAPPIDTIRDCLSAHRIVRLPGLIDVHVHIREPGATYKEDWSTGTAAALAGGVTTILVMPNTNPPITDAAALDSARQLARRSARCDFALYAAATPNNADSVCTLSPLVCGLKIYMDETFASRGIGVDPETDTKTLIEHFERWPRDRPIVVHAEGARCIASAILAAQLAGQRPLHVCHVARRDEIEIIVAAKKRGLPVTCEVTPHHLFLPASQLTTSRCTVRPPLNSEVDQQALWDNIAYIDCFATDHAPHTAEEKDDAEKSPPGFPGLETALSLLLTAVADGRLTIRDIELRMCENPRRIFGLPPSVNTWIEVDLDHEWVVPECPPHSRAGWTPFSGRRLRGCVRRVTLNGNLAYVDGRVLALPGSGREVRCAVAGSYISIEVEKPTLTLTALKMPPTPLVPRASEATEQLMPRFPVTPNSGPKIVQQPTYSLAPVSPGHQQTIIESPDMARAGPQTFSRSLSSSAPHPTGNVLSPPPHLASAAGSISFGFGVSGVTTAQINALATLTGRPILSTEMFAREHLHALYTLAAGLRSTTQRDPRSLTPLLAGRVLATMFLEPSTRTRLSFAAAMMRLGGSVIDFGDASITSLSKGESLADTVQVLGSYADAIVIRHPQPGAVGAAASHCRKPVINAGDGVGEHPTQALLDVFTIREELGTVNGMVVTICGDLKNGRTCHSLARLLALYDVKLRYVSPAGLGMPSSVWDYVASRGREQATFDSLESVLPETDVLYMTRLQRERFQGKDHEQIESEYRKFVVTPELMTQAKLRRMIVMHPLPRNDEISTAFDSDPRAAYMRQAEYGLAVRMALLLSVMGHHASPTSV